jgi:hypothetical protein
MANSIPVLASKFFPIGKFLNLLAVLPCADLKKAPESLSNGRSKSL